MARTKGSKNKKSLKERFMEKIIIDKNGCWNMQSKYPNPPFHVDSGIKKNARHVSLFLNSGKWSNATIEIKCGNFYCVNPEHFVVINSWEDRFWEKVNKKSDDECWEWIGYKDNKGYGILNNQHSTKAHRISWVIHNGKIPNKMCVCHHCDNPSCVNPNHLWLGSVAENNRDKELKGRHNGLRGERNFGSVLTEKQVLVIRDLYKTGNYSTYDLSEIFEVSRNCISRIINRKTWSYL